MRPTLKHLRDTLRPIYGHGESEAMIRLIFHALKGWNTTDLMIHEADSLSPFIKDRVASIEAALIEGRPIQYILGEAYFFGMWLDVAPGVLIPRPETAELIDIIIKENRDPDLDILDIGTGSGAIAIALARHLAFARVEAIDISPKAIEIASANAHKLKADIRICRADVFSFTPERASFDIIVSNPPYIADSEKADMERNVKDFEPHEALFVADSDPLIFYRRIAAIATDALKPGGSLYLEINPRFASALKTLLEQEGLCNVEIILDSFKRQRFAVAHKI